MKSVAFLIATLVLAAAAPTPGAPRGPQSTLATVFVSAPEGGDLERVLTANGLIVRRFDTPTAAIEAAPADSAVLVLAQGNPAQTTELPNSLFATVSQSGSASTSNTPKPCR